jgi:hypothetical protein
MLQCIRKPNSPEGWLTDMREHVFLFCLLGLVLTATIILVAAPGAVTWALARGADFHDFAPLLETDWRIIELQ